MYKSITDFIKMTIIALVCLAVPAIASDECTFSEDRILENIKRVASAYPGSSVDSKRLRASWVLDEVTVEYFEASGCYDYGEKAGRATETDKARDADAVIEVATELAQKFMTEQNQKRVMEAIDNGAIERVPGDETDVQFVGHPFGEIVITHSFAAGTDVVEIAWPVY